MVMWTMKWLKICELAKYISYNYLYFKYVCVYVRTKIEHSLHQGPKSPLMNLQSRIIEKE